MEAPGHRIESFFLVLRSRGRGMGVVIIPFDYEQLPESERKTIVPICISSVDRHGNPIAAVWFEVTVEVVTVTRKVVDADSPRADARIVVT